MVRGLSRHKSTRVQRRRLSVSVLLTELVSMALAACGSSSRSGKGTLLIYSAQHPETTAAIVAAFTKRTGIKVLLKNDDEDVLTAQLEQEGSRSPADVFYTENSNWLQQLDQRGMLAPISGGPRPPCEHRRAVRKERLAVGV